MTDMIERAAINVAAWRHTETSAPLTIALQWPVAVGFSRVGEQDKEVFRRQARAALLAALDPEDEALQQLWGDVIDRFSDPASHHAMATFFAELKAHCAQGETRT